MNAVDIHVALPDPEKLDLAGAEAIAFSLRTAIRPAILERLRAVAGEDGIDAYLARRELELRMAEIFNFSNAIEARIAAAGAAVPANERRPAVADLTGCVRRWVRARMRCFLTPESAFFVHGPSILHQSAALAQTILDDGDRLARVKSFSFRKELVHDPIVDVWDAREPERSPGSAIDRRMAAFGGSFTTSSGRELAFVGVGDPDHPVRDRAGRHALTARILARPAIGDAASGTTTHFFGLNGLSREELPRDAAGTLFAVIDAAVAAAAVSVGQDGRSWLFTQLDDQTIPDDMFAWLQAEPRFEIRPNWARARTMPGRGSIVRYHYRFAPQEERWRIGLVACLDGHAR